MVPFLLAKEGVPPKSGLTFMAKDPITVVFSIDTAALKVGRRCRCRHVVMSWCLRILAGGLSSSLPLFIAACFLLEVVVVATVDVRVAVVDYGRHGRCYWCV